MKQFLILFIPLLAAPAMAEENNFCAERPGQTTPPCVVAPGHLMIETGITSWGMTSDANGKTDAFTFGDSVLRVGIAPRLEAQLGWSPAVHLRTRDKTGNDITTAFNSGDVSLGLLYGLTGQNGPVAFQAFVTLPTGKTPVGAGDWGAGVRLPVQLPLAENIQLGLTPEVDKKVNSSGSGHHTAYGGAVGLGYAVTPKVSISTDVSLFRDDDPTGGTTSAISGLSLAWQVGANTQLDLSGGAGLNNTSPDLQFHFGVAHLF
jgi:hypothetical protein